MKRRKFIAPGTGQAAGMTFSQYEVTLLYLGTVEEVHAYVGLNGDTLSRTIFEISTTDILGEECSVRVTIQTNTLQEALKL